jgi:hypothetical protein
MNPILAVIPAVAATVYLFFASLGGLTQDSGSIERRNAVAQDTPQAASDRLQDLQSVVTAHGQLAVSAVPGASNYSMLANLNPGEIKLTRTLLPAMEEVAERNGLFHVAQTPEVHPVRVALQDTTTGLVPVPVLTPSAAVTTDDEKQITGSKKGDTDVSDSEQENLVLKKHGRIFLNKPVNFRGWRNEPSKQSTSK